MTDKTTDYAKVKGRPIRWLLRSPVVALAMHWTFQGLLYMDRTERGFKLLIDIVLTIGWGFLLRHWLPCYAAWPLALLAAHTLNFLFNGHVWGVLKHYGLVQLTQEQFKNYVQQLDARARREPSIRYVAVVGSLSDHHWKPSSDLDARIIRHPGVVNGLRACWFALCERSRALYTKFPLDLYIADSEESLDKLGFKGNAVPLSELSWQ